MKNNAEKVFTVCKVLPSFTFYPLIPQNCVQNLKKSFGIFEKCSLHFQKCAKWFLYHFAVQLIFPSRLHTGLGGFNILKNHELCPTLETSLSQQEH